MMLKKNIGERVVKYKLLFLSSLFRVIYEAFKYRKFVFVSSNITNNKEDFALNIRWQGITDHGAEIILGQAFGTVSSMNTTLQNAKNILEETNENN